VKRGSGTVGENSRCREKRTTLAIIREVFRLMNDGRRRSVAQIADELRLGWGSGYWAMRLIEEIQRSPLLRVERYKRKTFYQLSGRRSRE